MGRHKPGGEIPPDTNLVRIASTAADAWAAGKSAPDLELMVELEKFPANAAERSNAMAWGTDSVFTDLKRKLQWFEWATASAANFKEAMEIRLKCYNSLMQGMSGNGMGDIGYMLTQRQLLLVEEATEYDATTERSRTLLTESNNQWNTIEKHFTEQQELGKGLLYLTMLHDNVLKRMQSERLKYHNRKNLALHTGHTIKRDYVDNKGGCRVSFYFRSGLLGGSGGGLSRAEVRTIANLAARTVTGNLGAGTGAGGGTAPGAGAAGGGAGIGAGRGGLSNLPAMTLLREVETLANGDPILNRDGVPWRSHTCAFCQQTGRWCGHHRDQCVRNPASPLYGN